MNQPHNPKPINLAAKLAALRANEEINHDRIAAIADHMGISVDELMAGAVNYLENGTCLNEGPKWDGDVLPSDFWDHFEAATGRKVPPDERGSFFSCSC